MNSILQLAADGRADQVRVDQRVRALYSSYYFTKVVLGYRKLVPHFHQVEMERFTDNWANGDQEQAVEWSRAFYKTSCFTIGTGIWNVLPVTEEDTKYAIEELGIPPETWESRAILHDQDATQLLAFETEANACKKLGIIKWHFEENALFRWLFPEIAYLGTETPWNSKCLRIRRVGDRQKDAEGTFEAIGVGGALQSRHFKIMWLDDLVGEAAIKSQSVMQDTIGWFQRLSGAFENATRKTRFLISNRWGYDDLNSWVRLNEPNVKFHTRSAWELNAETGQEQPTFPEEFTMDGLLTIKSKMTSYDFSSQYLNSPTMPGEREVDLTTLHYYTVDEDANIKCNCGKTYRASSLYRYLHYDPYNAKGAKSVSCPALVVVGTSSDEHVFVLDYFVGKESYAKIYDQIFRLNDIWRPRMFTYEDVGHQNLTGYHIQKISQTAEYKATHKAFPRVEGLLTGNRAKERRIREGIFPVIEKKKFAIRSKHQLLLRMLEHFPHRELDHDYDLLDALSHGPSKTKTGIPVWRYPESEDTALAAKGGEDEFLAHFNEPYGYAGVINSAH